MEYSTATGASLPLSRNLSVSVAPAGVVHSSLHTAGVILAAEVVQAGDVDGGLNRVHVIDGGLNGNCGADGGRPWCRWRASWHPGCTMRGQHTEAASGSELGIYHPD